MNDQPPSEPVDQEELDRQTIATIRLLRHPAYGLTVDSSLKPLSRFHIERLKELEHEARLRKLKI